MLMRTHLLMGLTALLFFLPSVTYKATFAIVVLIATLLPDIDHMNSFLGNRWYLRPLQWATKHRGVMHSFSFCLLVSITLCFILPKLALPFFLGYSVHLFADSFTQDGIRPFWPFKDEVAGSVHVGGTVERGLFYGLILADAILFIRFFV